MTSSDDTRNSDNSTELSKDSIKLNINSRSLSVYERYLKQTLASENFRKSNLTTVEPSDKEVDNRSAIPKTAANDKTRRRISDSDSDADTYDSDDLSDEEIAFFDSLSDSDRSRPSRANKKITKQQKTMVAYENTATYQISEPAFANNTRVVAGNFDDRPNNTYRILTAIAIFCILLLIAIVVVILNANNSLVALSDRLGSVNTQMSAVNKNISVIGQETSLANAQAVADKKAAEAANAARLASVNESLNTIAANIKPIEYKSVSPSTTRLRSMNVGEVNTVPSVSYDDFKNESQTTLYREAAN